MVHARHATFVHNDVTNRHSAICFLLGSEAYGRADHARIEGNRIHHCGRLPRTNLDHGIYVEAAREALIRGNWIHDNADHGVNLYPNAQATLVTGNVIYGNGEGILFSGEDGAASSDNAVKGNVIADSRVRFNAESYWPAKNPVGRRNLLARNCLFGGPEGVVNGGVKEPTLGFKAVDNLVERPRFLNLGRRDLRLARETRCRSVLGRHTGKPGPR
jgi:nitrous oxidase accessory protein NosD